MTAAARTDRALERGLLLSAIALGVVLRLTMGWKAPLWLDETYTGVIAGQGSAPELYEWMRRELTGPVFYGIAWLVARVGGVSDFALRVPALVFSLGGLILVVCSGHHDLRTRLAWGALLALWWPGVFQASQARPQALLAFCAVVQAIAFLRAWRGGGAGWSWLWAGTTALMLLTHVYAAVPGGLQFLALAWALRSRWRHHASALLAFAPVIAWYISQIAFYLSFARPGVASYPVLQPRDVIQFAPDLLGGAPSVAWVLLVLAAGVAFIELRGRPRGRFALPALSGEAILALTGIAAALAIFALGMVRPAYVARYMVPCAPSVLLGIAMALMRATGEFRRALPAMVAIMLFHGLIVGALSLSARRQLDIYPLEFEQASDWLMADGNRRPVLFTWDYPVAAINPDRNLEEVGGFFFARAGQPRRIIVARPPSGPAAAAPLAAAARARQADIIWIGDRKWPKALLATGGLDCKLWHRKAYSKAVACRYRGDSPMELTRR